jgi:hypothetical protein
MVKLTPEQQHDLVHDATLHVRSGKGWLGAEGVDQRASESRQKDRLASRRGSCMAKRRLKSEDCNSVPQIVAKGWLPSFLLDQILLGRLFQPGRVTLE